MVRTHWREAPKLYVTFLVAEGRVMYRVSNPAGEVVVPLKPIYAGSRCSLPGAMTNGDIDTCYAKVVVHCELQQQYGMADNHQWWEWSAVREL
jgi:hypothetical protein